ncbi:metallophosphoesterase [Terricaulis silvestris]|uniref:3',5'-cyclic adenosine monophosphate phosphodiesterase CpdA n=1 Tax=Terricaulis silvestris TaxID=2686094 RepID=A0A6I6MWF8_9CAUL|nr:metallophosphoesterase [Terricaulis silvestris]QGZ96754.1 3',5'-cyclic adenosine monophosphate phosphodiesterase CpdA [Terricaulis silvestris]
MSGQFILAQISDTHIRADDDGLSARQLERALAEAHEYRADVILLTGDLANDERPDEYDLLARIIEDVSRPLYLMPGNHDDRALIRNAFPRHGYLPRSGFLSFAIDDFPVRLVVIDQIVPGETHGLITHAGADWLDRTLAEAPDKPTIVALHHPPFLTHDMLFDNIGLLDADLFASVIARHRQVERVICGHHHRVAVGQVAHAPVVIAPSTSWVYGLAMYPGQKIAPKTAEQPGWMLHVRSDTGGLASHFMGL